MSFFTKPIESISLFVTIAFVLLCAFALAFAGFVAACLETTWERLFSNTDEIRLAD